MSSTNNFLELVAAKHLGYDWRKHLRRMPYRCPLCKLCDYDAMGQQLCFLCNADVEYILVDSAARTMTKRLPMVCSLQSPQGEESQLLRAIAADPDDDTLRLAYADWEQEHRDPARAEFIRRHIASFREGCDDPVCVRLLAAHMEWATLPCYGCHGAPDGCGVCRHTGCISCVLQRGLPSAVAIHSTLLQPVSPWLHWLLPHCPVTELYLSDRRPVMRYRLKCPWGWRDSGAVLDRYSADTVPDYVYAELPATTTVRSRRRDTRLFASEDVAKAELARAVVRGLRKQIVHAPLTSHT